MSFEIKSLYDKDSNIDSISLQAYFSDVNFKNIIKKIEKDIEKNLDKDEVKKIVGCEKKV